MKVELTKLIEAGAHFGHLTRRWNPKMKPYIFMEKNGIYIIDLKKTQVMLEQAVNSIRDLVAGGKTVLFVGTKKQAKDVIAAEAKRCEMNWVSERWLGGMLTNFATIRKSIKRLKNIDKMETDGTFDKITKKEQLHLTRERDKLRKVLEGIEYMNKIPNAIFIVDTKKESIAIREALRLNIPIYAIVDTNCDPDPIDYIIPANDDAVRTIEIILKSISDAVIEGLQKQAEVLAQEKAEREREKKENEDNKQKRTGKPRVRKVKFDSKGGKKSDKREIKIENATKENAKDDNVNNKSKNDDKSEKVNSENVKEKTIQEEKKITKDNDKPEQAKITEEKSTESEKDNEKTENK